MDSLSEYAKLNGHNTTFIEDNQPQGVQGLGNSSCVCCLPGNEVDKLDNSTKSAAGLCMLQLAVRTRACRSLEYSISEARRAANSQPNYYGMDTTYT